MHTIRDSSRRRAHAAAVTACALAVFTALTMLTGCSSDSKSDSSATTLPAADCPFSGTIGDSSGGTAASEALTMSSVASSKAGCIDEFQFNFEPTTGTWSAGYSTGPVTDANGDTVAPPGAAQLVLTFNGATYAQAGAAQATIAAPNLDYVEGVTAAPGPNGALLVVIGLDKQRPYTASSSKAPAAYVTVGIGG